MTLPYQRQYAGECLCAGAVGWQSYSPDGDSAFGVADLAGNVLEWVGTVFDLTRFRMSGLWLGIRRISHHARRLVDYRAGEAARFAARHRQSFCRRSRVRCAADVTPRVGGSTERIIYACNLRFASKQHTFSSSTNCRWAHRSTL